MDGSVCIPICWHVEAADVIRSDQRRYHRLPMASPDRRSRLFFWLRIVVSLGLVALLVHKRPNLHDAIPSHHHSTTILWLTAAVLMAATGVVLSAWRWQRVLHVYGHDVSLWRLTSHTLVGLCVGNVLPSTIGGDVARITRLGRDIANPEVAFASVALERLTGFVALPLLVMVGFTLDPSLLNTDQAWLALLIAGITLGLLGAVLLLAGHPKAAGRFADRVSWVRFIGAVHIGVDELRKDLSQALAVLIAAVLYQASVVASVMLIAEAIDLPAPKAAVIAFVPAVAMVQVLPISLNGLGVREGLLIRFLHPLGVSNGQAIALGLLWYASLLIVSLGGVPAFIAGRRVDHNVSPNASEPIAP